MDIALEEYEEGDEEIIPAQKQAFWKSHAQTVLY
jgi:hypothetical protein